MLIEFLTTWGPRARIKQNKNNNKYFPEINPCTHGQLIYDTHRRHKHTMEKRQSLQQMVVGKLDSYMQKSFVDPYLTPYTRIN